MGKAEFKVLFDGNAASAEVLERIETIRVEQDVDRAWEASLEIPICLSDGGAWRDDDEPFMQSFNRVRIEIKVEGDWIALIDGPIVGRDTERSSQPGESQVTLRVHDDTVLLNQQADTQQFESATSDSEVAEQLFGAQEAIARWEVQQTAQRSDPLANVTQSATEMALLRTLARRNRFNVGVMPGESPGESVGVFHALPLDGVESPDLVLLGPQQNVESLNLQHDAQSATTVTASTLSFADKSITTTESRSDALASIGGESRPEPQGALRLRPDARDPETVQHDTESEARHRGRAFRGSGSVISGCYSGVLRPYGTVTLRAGDTRASGRYLVTGVTHSIGRSEYKQDFRIVGDGELDPSAAISVPLGSR